MESKRSQSDPRTKPAFQDRGYCYGILAARAQQILSLPLFRRALELQLNAAVPLALLSSASQGSQELHEGKARQKPTLLAWDCRQKCLNSPIWENNLTRNVILMQP